jgi:cell wall-associated NlpC family hydrolase
MFVTIAASAAMAALFGGGGGELQPGDLVFYGNPNTKIHHVGLYIGNGQMIDARTYGKPVGIRPIRSLGDDFAGGGRVVEGQQL